MTVKDLIIGSPVYRVSLDNIDVAHVRLIEQFNDGTRTVELNAPWQPRCNAEEKATELREYEVQTTWFINIEDAELEQLMRRSECVAKLKEEMESAQNRFADAINRYAFSEPSKPKEL